MLRDLADALLAPRPFFGALAARAPSRGRAFLALLIPFTAGAIVQALRVDTLLAQPAVVEALARGGLSPETFRPAFVAGLLSVGPLGALSTWVAGWMPLRLGAGRFARLGEVAAWTQLPTAVVGALGMAAGALGVVPPTNVSFALQAATLAWCGWLVYESLRVFSPRTLRSGVTVYVLFSLVGLALAGAAGLVSTPGSSGTLVF